MNNTLILTGAAAFFYRRAVCLADNTLPSPKPTLYCLQELAESRRLHEFAEQVQAQTAADLAQSRQYRAGIARRICRRRATSRFAA